MSRENTASNIEPFGLSDAEKPLAIDLFCGLGGWAEGLLAENWRVIGFDVERHVYGDHRYPAQLVIQDVHGSQFKNAALIVASPPCQAYSYRAMPWKRAKALLPPDNTLFETCFRIQREACEAAGRHIPLIVRGAQKWVGRARWSYGSFYLWGDVPALMPITLRGVKGAGPKWDASKGCGTHGMKRWTNPAEHGRKVGGDDFFRNGSDWMIGRGGPGTPAREFASAMIAKIPLPLSRHIGAVFKNNWTEREHPSLAL